MTTHNNEEWQYEEEHGKSRVECAIDVLTVLVMMFFLGWLFKDFL